MVEYFEKVKALLAYYIDESQKHVDDTEVVAFCLNRYNMLIRELTGVDPHWMEFAK